MKRIIIFVFLIFLVGCTSLDSEMTMEDCLSLDGRVVNTLDGGSCEISEIDKGNVVGLDCPCICCVPK